MDIHIYDTRAEVLQFAQLAADHADSQKDALGFLPRSAYTEAAAQGKLYVATIGDGRSECYAGHLLFGGRFPHFKIFQVNVDSKFRGRHIGRQLVEKLVTRAEQHYYLTISARVGADLESANEFWEHLGFAAIRVEDGGITTGRRINIRVRELDSPTLFSNMEDVRGVDLLPKPEEPVYALDVNVFLDVVKDRQRAEPAKRLITAAMSGVLRLFVTKEFVEELTRAAQNPEADPILQLATALPQFPEVPPEFLQSLQKELAELIFPARCDLNVLRTRELSDLLHLATTIYHSAAGFVTSDGAILRRRDEIERRYRIDVAGPAELAELYIPSQWNATQVNALAQGGTAIEMAEITEGQRKFVEAFLQSCHWSDEQIAHALLPGQAACRRHRVLVSYGGCALAFASWDPPRPPRSQSAVWIATAPMHPMAHFAADALVERMERDICAAKPACALLAVGTRNRQFHSIAVSRGFIPVGAGGKLSRFEKPCLGEILTPSNWAERQIALFKAVGLTLPEAPPKYCGPATSITYSWGATAVQTIPISAFEVRFGPVILFLSGRPAVVLPIQRSFADQLLGTSEQFSLLPQTEASMWREKLYFSSPRALAAVSAGTIIFFYESKGSSGGRGAITAVAQVVRTALRKKSVLDSTMTRRGVLSGQEIENLSVAEEAGLIYFSQLMHLKRPVPIHRLRAIGCMDGANFVTARQIAETAAWTIIEEGQPSVRV